MVATWSTAIRFLKSSYSVLCTYRAPGGILYIVKPGSVRSVRLNGPHWRPAVVIGRLPGLDVASFPRKPANLVSSATHSLSPRSAPPEFSDFMY